MLAGHALNPLLICVVCYSDGIFSMEQIEAKVYNKFRNMKAKLQRNNSKAVNQWVEKQQPKDQPYKITTPQSQPKDQLYKRTTTPLRKSGSLKRPLADEVYEARSEKRRSSKGQFEYLDLDLNLTVEDEKTQVGMTLHLCVGMTLYLSV